METVIFIHGYGGGSYEYFFLKRYLRKKGFARFREFNYMEKFDEIPFEELSKRLIKFVKKIKGKVNIIGFSQGGIIARYASKYLKNKIKKIICICSPHKGTYLAYLSRNPGAVELRPRSKFLKKIKDDKTIEYYSIYSPLDLMILPGWKAIHPGSKVKMIWSPAHLLSFWWPATLKFVYESLRR